MASTQWVVEGSFAWGKATPNLFQKNGTQNTALSRKHTKEEEKKNLFNYTNHTHNMYSLNIFTVFLYLEGIAALLFERFKLL